MATVLSRTRASLGRAFAYMRQAEPPVLPPYALQRAPFNQAMRRAGLLTIVALLGAIYGFFYALLPPAFLLYLLVPIIVLLLMIIWALPDRETAPTRLLEILFIAFFLSLALWPNYLALDLPGLPWISARRLFAGPMTLVLLICVSTSSRFRETLAKVLHETPLLWKLIVALVVIQILSLPFSNSYSAAINVFVNDQIMWTAVFFTSVHFFLKPGRIRWWATALCLVAVTVCLVALWETYLEKLPWADHIPSFLAIDDESVQRTLTSNFRGGAYRAKATFTVALPFAEFLALVCPFVIHAFLLSSKVMVRAACIAAEILILSVILLTQARLGLVGFFVAHAVYILNWAVRRWRRMKTDIIGPALTLAYPALFALMVVSIFTVDALHNRIVGSSGQTRSSNEARFAQWALVPDVVMRGPLGHGPGQGGLELGYTNPSGVLTVDSYPVTLLADYGPLGLIVFTALFVVAIIRSGEIGTRASDPEMTYALPLSLSLVVFVVIRTVLSSEENHSFMFMMLGMVAALVYRSRRNLEAAKQG